MHVWQSCEGRLTTPMCWETGSLRSNGICPPGFGTFLRPVTPFVFSISPFWNEKACPTILYLGSTWKLGITGSQQERNLPQDESYLYVIAMIFGWDLGLQTSELRHVRTLIWGVGAKSGM